MRILGIVLFLCGVVLPLRAVQAADVQIRFAELNFYGGAWQAEVTLQHEDTGWKNYADAWRLVDGKGRILATRVLWHPHVDEQPFTRGLDDIHIPEGTRVIFVEAHGKVEGWSKQRLRIDLDKPNGDNYKVRR
jgi:hypothetical protein